MRNPFKRLEFPERVMLCLVIFLLIAFIIDAINNGGVENSSITEALKAIGEIFGG